MNKADYVRSQGQDRAHTCHWPGCTKQVPPAMWGCKAHWFKLPQSLRNKIWAAYVPGQEKRMDPSDQYIAVAREVEQWIRENATPVQPKKPAPVEDQSSIDWNERNVIHFRDQK